MDGKQRLRERIGQPGPLLVAGAHDGLTAKLVEEAGFDAVWASGFEISASHCVPDANILTMADQLRAAAWMVKSSVLPVIADCDNGYGNAINVIHMVKAYESEGIAAVCIEDNVFPKRCSFYAGVRRELAPVEEHAGKIEAVLATRRSDDFMVIARTEALIAGWGMDEALMRGRAYADAGADFVLIHSKSPSADEVMEFARQWDREAPLVCVPTIYKSADATSLHAGGFKVVIYANHVLRSGIKAQREALARIARDQRCDTVDDLVVPLNDVYELIGVPQMKADEKSYLPAGGTAVGAIVLAAGATPGLGELTKDRPKTMLDVKGKSILARQVEALNSSGIKDISVVVGWKKEAVTLPNVRKYAADGSSGEMASLMEAADELDRRTLVLYGDLLFDQEIVQRLLQTEGDVVLVVDRNDLEGRPGRDLVRTRNATGDDNGRFLHGSRSDELDSIGQKIDGANGEWIGMLMLSEKGAAALKAAWTDLEGGKGAVHEAANIGAAALTDLLQVLVERGLTVNTIDTYKGWMEIDTFEDYQRAWAQL
ncbi:MAG: isocitrate lyase/phosphoenolpyruvate mutase family protein [Planctomycetota bacterium]|nr:isocitrate lyase/phosphoenolpyruvate mutase family protein [Planctomycetota bacterium]